MVYSRFVERLAAVRLAVFELRPVFGIFRAVFTVWLTVVILTVSASVDHVASRKPARKIQKQLPSHPPVVDMLTPCSIASVTYATN